VVDLAFSSITPDGFFLLTASKDNLPMIRVGSTGDWIGTFQGHKGAVWGVAFDATAQRAATASADFTAKIWNACTGEETHSFAHPHIVKAVDFSPDGTRLATACNEKALRVFEIGSSAEPMVLAGHTAPAKKVLWVTDTVLASGGEDKTVRLWDTRTRQATKTITVGAAVTSMELCRAGSVLLVTYGETIAKYDPTTLDVIEQVSVQAPVLSASLHPTMDVVAWGGMDGIVRLVGDAPQDIKEECRGHFGPVHCVRMSPDGEVLASGSEDGTARLWQVRVGTEYGLWRALAEDSAAP
jgi:serine-threonine kinase receptor-associated protein